MRAYHFINLQYGLQGIKRRKLKISRLEDLNDPFELMSLELSNKTVRNAFIALKTQLDQSRGILCFSERWDNPVIWSHYADKHKGICLEFEVPSALLSKINYSQARLKDQIKILLNSDHASQEEAMMRVLMTKFAHWRYERERRIFLGLEEIESDGNYYADFSDELKLVGVIVGARCQVTRTEIAAALSEGKIAKPVKVFKARLAFKSFRVVRNHNEKLWT